MRNAYFLYFHAKWRAVALLLILLTPFLLFPNEAVSQSRNVKRLIRVVDNPKESKVARARAARELGKMGAAAKSAVPSLMKILDDQDVLVRINAARALGRIGPDAKDAYAAMLAALKDEDEYMRRVTAEAIGKIGPPGADQVEHLTEDLKAKEHGLRYTAATALGEIGAEAARAVPALIVGLEDANERVSDRAAWALGRIGPEAKAALQPLREALQRKHASAKKVNSAEPANALAKLGPEGVGILMEDLRTGDKYVQMLAAVALRTLGPEDKDSVPLLIEALEDKYKIVRRNAASALDQIGTPEAKDAMKRYLQRWKGEWKKEGRPS